MTKEPVGRCCRGSRKSVVEAFSRNNRLWNSEGTEGRTRFVCRLPGRRKSSHTARDHLAHDGRNRVRPHILSARSRATRPLGILRRRGHPVSSGAGRSRWPAGGRAEQRRLPGTTATGAFGRRDDSRWPVGHPAPAGGFARSFREFCLRDHSRRQPWPGSGSAHSSRSRLEPRFAPVRARHRLARELVSNKQNAKASFPP